MKPAVQDLFEATRAHAIKQVIYAVQQGARITLHAIDGIPLG